MSDKKAIYDLKVDQKQNKFGGKNQLIKVDNKQLPSYIFKNLEKFTNWID